MKRTNNKLDIGAEQTDIDDKITNGNEVLDFAKLFCIRNQQMVMHLNGGQIRLPYFDNNRKQNSNNERKS